MAMAMAMAGCFSPSERDGAVACGENGACPPGYECFGGDGLCYRDLPEGARDGGTFDGGTPADASPNAPDGASVDADLTVTADEFCAQYEPVCGYAANPNRYDNLTECLESFDAYDAERQACVIDRLQMADDGIDVDSNCQAASGKSPCN